MHDEVTFKPEMSSVKLKVKMPLAFGLRLWVATKLILLAGVITGFTVEITHEEDE